MAYKEGYIAVIPNEEAVRERNRFYENLKKQLYRNPMKKLLFNIVIGTKARQHYEVSKSCFVSYAQRHGYDYKCITESTGYTEPHYCKMYAIRAFKEGYDCVAYFDVDGILNPYAPDIANGKDSGIWMFDEINLVESPPSINTLLRASFNAYCNDNGVKWDGAKYYNSGVFVAFPDATDILDIQALRPGKHCHEQHCINLRCVQNPEMVHDLPDLWNWHRLQFTDKLEFALRGEAYFSHFAGLWSRGNDNGIGNMKRIKEVFIK